MESAALPKEAKTLKNATLGFLRVLAFLIGIPPKSEEPTDDSILAKLAPIMDFVPTIFLLFIGF
jgi:hypothetical protein